MWCYIADYFFFQVEDLIRSTLVHVYIANHYCINSALIKVESWLSMSNARLSLEQVESEVTELIER